MAQYTIRATVRRPYDETVEAFDPDAKLAFADARERLTAALAALEKGN